MPGNGYDSIWLLSQRATNSTHTHTHRQTHHMWHLSWCASVCVCLCSVCLFVVFTLKLIDASGTAGSPQTSKRKLVQCVKFSHTKSQRYGQIPYVIWQRQCQWMRSATVCMREQASRTEIVQSLAKELWQLSNCFENEFMVVISFSMDNQCTVG